MKFDDFVRATNDTDRCAKGSCPYRAVEDTGYCQRHGANKIMEKRARKLQYDFKVERIRKRVDLLTVDPNRYRLDEELALMRVTLEDTINSITTRGDSDYALFQGSDTIRNLIGTIGKLTQDCVTQSRALGLLMTADEFLEEVQKIIDIVAEEIQDEETIIRVAQRIGSSFGQQRITEQSNESPLQLDHAAPDNSGSAG